MEIVDLTSNYLPFAEGTADIAEYQSSYPAFFNHYAKFWGGGATPATMLPGELVELRRELVLRHLYAASSRLEECGIGTEGIRAVLFVGNNLANGHAFLDGDTCVAWFALETFETELTCKVFVMHELIHALHYKATPQFFFTTKEEQYSISRQLVVEGIATHLTKSLWGLTDEEALWGDVLTPEEIRAWMRRCSDVEQQLLDFVLDHFDSSNPSIQLFNHTDSSDIYSNRAGYFAGFKVIERIASSNELTPYELLTIPHDKLMTLTREMIHQMIV